MTEPKDEVEEVGGTLEFEELLSFIHQSRELDFSGYKRASLMRRTNRRVAAVGLKTYTEYRDYLEVHPEEFAVLFNSILINVTSFLRDPEAWGALAAETIPAILAAKSGDLPIRVWSAGCSTGQEACTAAMLLAEALGPVGFRERVKIYATDVDDDALAYARHASYTEAEVEGVPPEWRAKYFERVGDRYVFSNDTRRAVIFGRHDLIQDAPISHLDLLICRNTLMYFNAEAQGRVLGRLHFALNDAGYVFLGRAEMLMTHGDLFAPVNLKQRIFVKVRRPAVRPSFIPPPRPEAEVSDDRLLGQARLWGQLAEVSPVAQVVVDTAGILALANQRARTIFGVAAAAVGRRFQDQDLSYRPLELRSIIRRTVETRQPFVQKDVAWSEPSGEAHLFDVEVVPLVIGDVLMGVSVTFTEVSQVSRLREELEHSRQNLETAYEELQSANEEMETTNEELQSSNEELETTNEELQSTNEEMETMNEELQASNEELRAMNDELRQRSEEAGNANAFLRSIMAGLHVGLVAVDANVTIDAWNRQAEELWGVQSAEVVGKSLLTLDTGLPVEKLTTPIQRILSAKAEYDELVVDAVNRRGRKVRCRVTCHPRLGADGKVKGVILLMEQQGVEPAAG